MQNQVTRTSSGRPQSTKQLKTDQHLLWLTLIKEFRTFMPSDVIVDASMPAMIRTWEKCGIKTVKHKIHWQ
jgi:hypothetical protein